SIRATRTHAGGYNVILTILLRLQEVKLATVDEGIGEIEGAVGIKLIRPDGRPQIQWQRHIGRAEDVIRFARRAAGAAHDDLVAGDARVPNHIWRRRDGGHDQADGVRHAAAVVPGDGEDEAGLAGVAERSG